MMGINNQNRLYDVIIIGGGPAGLAAALYIARAKYKVVVLEKNNFGGQITITSEIENYPGVEKMSGTELTDIMRKQAESFGAEFMIAEAFGISSLQDDVKTVNTSKGDFYSFGIIVATGANPRMIGFEGESEFRGRGVAYCATCDGEFFTDKEVFVIGGGFAAAEESVFLTKYARHVTVLIRSDDFKCSKSAADAAKNHEKITVIPNTEIISVSGDNLIRSIKYRNNKTGDIAEYTATYGESFGIFVFAGYNPATEILEGITELDENGYVIIDDNRKTNVDGIYAAGDICVKNLRQVVTAVSDGAVAATEMEKYVAVMQKKTKIYPVMKKASQSNIQKGDNGNELFTDDIKVQLDTVFSKMESNIVLKLYLNNKPFSSELRAYMEAIAQRTDKIKIEIYNKVSEKSDLPVVCVCNGNGEETGLSFHGVPGGHEFTSFILGLYNVAGPGQKIDVESFSDIKKISKQINIQVFVSLSCTMCPETVTAAQYVAAHCDYVTAEIYDINHFPGYKEIYNIMSVPCLVINEKTVFFGKKNLHQLIGIIKEI